MTSPLPRFEFIEHTADIRQRITARSIEELFVTATAGMMSYLFSADPVRRGPERRERISIESDCVESLLVDWLSHLLYGAVTKEDLVTKVLLESIDDRKVVGSITATPAQLQSEIKAVTRHGLKIAEKDGVLEATILFDI